MKFAPLTRTIELYDAIKRIRIKLECIIDSGSAVSLITFGNVKDCTISPLTTQLELSGAFGGTDVEMIGEICLYLYVDGVKRPLNFLVIDNSTSLQCIIGWPDIQRLQLNISHEGILTKERRLFGQTKPNRIQLVNKTSGLAVYKIDVANAKPTGAIHLGNGVFESAKSGLIHTNDEVEPTLLNDFTKSAKLQATPTTTVKTTVSEAKNAIMKAWDDGKFQIDTSVTTNQRDRIKNILLEYSSCISVKKNEIGNLPNFIEEFTQQFDSSEPTPCPIYPVNPTKAEFLCEEINKLCELDVLKEVKTRVITSNLLAVPKKDGEWRAVSDLRWVNKHTKPTNLVLSRLDQIANKLMGKNYYVSLDVQKAYWSVKIPDDQKKWYTIQCAKCWKTYAWQRMVMGAKNAATVFSHMIQLHVVGDLHDHVTTYIDDITFSVNTVDEGIKTLEILLKRMSEHGLKIGIGKMQLFSKELDAFGFHFSKSGLEPMNDRISALSNRIMPNTKKDLHSALASLNYFRGFIPNFSANAAPLYALTSEKTEYSQEVVKKYWPQLIELLKNTVKIQCPDYSKPMILSTDASSNGLGAVLSQEDDLGGRRIIGVHSMGLNSSEKLWAIAQKELKGIFEGLVKFEHILLNQPIIIETDNNAIFYLLKLRIGSVEINRRLPAVRFLLYISSFQFEVRHVSGKQPSFLLADFLSRQGYEVGEESKFLMGNTSRQPLLSLKAMKDGKYDVIPVNMVSVSTNDHKKDYVDEVMNVHRLDKSMNELHNLIKLAQEDSKFCQSKKAAPDGSYMITNNILYKTTNFGPMIVCPKFYSGTIIKYIHESQHEGIRRTLEKLTKYRIWIFQKYRNVVAYVQNCKICDPARSGPCLQAKNYTIANPRLPMDILHVDLMNIGPIFVLVTVDSYSKFIMTRVLKEGTSVCIKHAMIEIMTTFGIPHTICQDNGANLNSSIMNQFYKDLGIILSRTTVNNSRANSIAERAILKIQSKTRQFGTENGHLHLNLYLITHKINLEKPKNQKFTPFEIMFNRTSSWILQIPELSKARKFAQDEELKKFYDLSEEIREDMEKLVERKRQNVLKETKKKPVLKKSDHVRIKKFIMKNNKKSFRPFSETIWEVMSVNPHTNTCFLREVTNAEFQPRIRKIHTRFLRKVLKKVSNEDDDLCMVNMDEKRPQTTKIVQDSSKPQMLKQLEKMADEMNAMKNEELKHETGTQNILEHKKKPKNQKILENTKNDQKGETKMKNSADKILEHRENSRNSRIPRNTRIERKMSNHPMTLRTRSIKGINTVHTNHSRKRYGTRRQQQF